MVSHSEDPIISSSHRQRLKTERTIRVCRSLNTYTVKITFFCDDYALNQLAVKISP